MKVKSLLIILAGLFIFENAVFRYGGKFVGESGSVLPDSSAVFHIGRAVGDGSWILHSVFRDLFAHGTLVSEKGPGRGTFSGTDADPERPGFQVASLNGRIGAEYETDGLS